MKTTGVSEAKDTIYARTQPAKGLPMFLRELEESLSGADTVGRRHRVLLDNIGFFVGTDGKIDSAWIIFRPKRFHEKIITFLKATPWTPAKLDGERVVSHQELDTQIYLTKAALKRHGYWCSLPERILSPWMH